MLCVPGTLPVALASLLDSFDRLHSVGGLDLSQNPWEHPPEAIVTGGMLAVRGYFEAIFRGGTTVVTRPLKVVIVGMETVGKTSLRCSIKAGKPCMTRGGGVDSTVHVDVQDHNLDVQDHKAGGHPIRIFDCAGQAAYYGLLQLFLTPRAVYLLVWDAEKASQMDELNLEDLAIAPWLRQMTFRVPDANVVLVGNKWDLVAEANLHVADDVERKSREWLTAWIESAHRHQPPQLSLEAGVSLVSCAPSGRAGWAPSFGGRKAWPCDKNKPGQPGLFRRIIYNPVDDMRAVTMRLSPVYVLALNLLEELASRSRVDALGTAGTTAAASEAALSGAILIRKWEGGLVEYGNYIFLDVGWFADVLDPLFSHKKDSNGIIYLGGKTVTNDDSLKRLDANHIFEPRLAEDLWGAELAPHLLSALNSAGLTFPIPNDPFEGLVVVLRMDTEPPPDYRTIVEEEQARKYYDLRLVVQCSFRLGLPPGFVERLLARCCHLGFPHPFWRYGALVVGAGAEEGKFSLTLEYSEEDKTLKVQVNGRCSEVHAWATLSKVLSVTIKMLSEFPGLPCQLEFLCPRHEDKSMRVLKANNARPGSRLVEEGNFCPVCPDRTAGNDLLGAALHVVEYSDTEFSDAQLRKRFADNAKRVARQGRALWPASVTEVGSSTTIASMYKPRAAQKCRIPMNTGPLSKPCGSTQPVCIETLGCSGLCELFFDRRRTQLFVQVSDPAPPQISPISPASLQTNPSSQDSRTPRYQDRMRAWVKDLRVQVGAAGALCVTVFGVFYAKEDDDPRLWGLFLGIGLVLAVVEFVLVAKLHERWCFKSPRVEAASAGNQQGCVAV
ncbi:unnamed protein product [Ectocarpus sp. CCAP 1310/34]|nr:unnamed protein product [Ectocarpus sp. CCAP 1310/34]